jgi:hypothetical protein
VRTMRFGPRILVLLPAALVGGCEQPGAPGALPSPLGPGLSHAQSTHLLPAAGTFTQTAVTAFDLRFAGSNVIIEQTVQGSVTGTLTGSFEDRIRVVVHPGGNFTARGTTTCACTVEGREGLLELTIADTGEQIGPDLGVFAGRSVIRRGTGELTGLRGVFDIEGTVDIPSGLSTYTYSGTIHFRP